jgi:glycine cleavage system H lipoate-binding protein
MVNSNAFDSGWIFRLKMEDPAQLQTLLDADGYARVL